MIATQPVEATKSGAIVSGVVMLSVGHLLAFVDRSKVAGMLPAIRAQIPMSEAAAAAVLGTAFAVAYVVTLLVVAGFDRGARSSASWRLAAGVLLWACASASTGLATNALELLGARALLGVGQALFIPAALTAIAANSATPAVRAKQLSLFTASSSLGRSVGLLLAGAALGLVLMTGVASDAQAWRWVFAITVVPNLVLFTLLRAPQAEDRVDGSTAEAEVPDSSRSTRALFLCLGLTPLMLLQAAINWLPTMLASGAGMTVQRATFWAGIVVLVAGPLGQLAGGRLIARLGAHGRVVPLVIVGAMLASLPGFASAAMTDGALAIAVGVGWAYFVLGIAALAVLHGWQDLVSPRRRLAGNGLYMALVTAVGLGAGPLLTGVIADQAIPLPMALLRTALVCITVALLAAMVRISVSRVSR